MEHPVTTSIRFLCYAGCIGYGMLFAMSYKLGAGAIVLSAVFFALAAILLIQNAMIAGSRQ